MARNFFIRPDSASADCSFTDDSGIEDEVLDAQTGGNEADTYEVPQGSNITNYQVFTFIMPSGEIGGEDLPASSLFTAVLDITVIDSQISCRAVFHAFDSG